MGKEAGIHEELVGSLNVETKDWEGNYGGAK